MNTKVSPFLHLVRILALAITLMIWWWLIRQPLDWTARLLVLVAGALMGFPVVWIGRRLLDAEPTPHRAQWATTFVHFGLMCPLGASIIEAVLAGQAGSPWGLPLVSGVGQVLMAVSTVVVILTVLNLALQGLGAPFAIALSRRLAAGWLYSWTRNPMVLGGLVCVIGLGLYLQSTLILAWVLLLVTPAMIFFLKAYEERELEVRFGPSYLSYKARTPMLWPRRPQG